MFRITAKSCLHMVFFGNRNVSMRGSVQKICESNLSFFGGYSFRLLTDVTVYTSINQRRIFVTFESIFLAMNYS